MNLAGKLRLKCGQSVSIVNEPERLALDDVWSALRPRSA